MNDAENRDPDQPEPGEDSPATAPVAAAGASFDSAGDSAGRSAASSEPGPARPVQQLESRVVPFWMLSGFGSVVVLAAIVGLALRIFGEALPGGALIPTAVMALLGLLLLWALVMPALAWRRWRFGLDEELLVARYGVVFHEEKSIPISRMQHVDLTRGPIERVFGLATLIVFTAGSEGATFRVPGLTVERARSLRDHILRARGDDVI